MFRCKELQNIKLPPNNIIAVQYKRNMGTDEEETLAIITKNVFTNMFTLLINKDGSFIKVSSSKVPIFDEVRDLYRDIEENGEPQ